MKSPLGFFTTYISVVVIGCCLVNRTSSLINKNSICVKEMTNGCSAPAIFKSNKYVRIFDPACLRHDVCYQCGPYFEWTKKDCDASFLEDMKAICYLRHSSKRYSWWRRFKIFLSLGYDVVRWWTIPGDSLEHCLHGARIFYQAVDGFGHSHYGNEHPSNRYCNHSCALQMGDPSNGLYGD